MNLRDYLSVVRDYWKSTLAITFAGLLVALSIVWASNQSAQFMSQSSVFVGVSEGGTAREVLGGANFAAQQAAVFARLCSQDIVLRPVVDKLGLEISVDELAKSVTGSSNTSVIDIQVTNKDGLTAARVAQAVAEQLVATIKRLSPVDGSGSATLTTEVVGPASAPSPVESGLSARSLIAVGVLGGLVLGLGQAAIRRVLRISATDEP